MHIDNNHNQTSLSVFAMGGDGRTIERHKETSVLTPLISSGAPTSLIALRELLESGRLHTQEIEYYNLMKRSEDGLTDGEAALLMNLPRSTVSARRNGLIKRWTVLHDQGEWPGHLIISHAGETRRNPGKNSKNGKVWRTNV